MRPPVTRPSEPLGAYLEPFVAAVLVRENAEWLRRLEAYGQRLILGGDKRRGLQVLDSIARLRNSAQQYAEAGDRSVLPPTSPPPETVRTTVTTADAAERLGVKVRQVRNLLVDGPLEGVRVGGQWLVYEDSLLLELERRRGLADTA